MRPGAALVLALLAALPSATAQGTLFGSPHTATCYLDVNGDSLRGLDEPVYLQQACTIGVAAGDARFTAWDDMPGGTIVNGSHPDAGLQTRPIASAYAFYDGDGGGGYNLGDPLFLAFGTLPGPANPGDLPLTGDDVFTSLRGNDSRIGLPLRAASVAVGGESYAERDGNQGFTTGDTLFLDLDATGTSTLGDLRLAIPGQTVSPSSSSSTSPSASPIPSPSTNTSSTAVWAGTSTTSPSTGAVSGAPHGTPLPGLIAVVAIALAVQVRRPR
jgi:hypothetical protein